MFFHCLNFPESNTCYAPPLLSNSYTKLIILNKTVKFNLILEIEISKIFMSGFGHYYFRLKIFGSIFNFSKDVLHEKMFNRFSF